MDNSNYSRVDTFFLYKKPVQTDTILTHPNVLPNLQLEILIFSFIALEEMFTIQNLNSLSEVFFPPMKCSLKSFN